MNAQQTTAVINSDVAAVNGFEPLIKSGTQLIANRSINSNADRICFGALGYNSSDDNSPGLGTQMNEGQCGVQQLSSAQGPVVDGRALF